MRKIVFVDPAPFPYYSGGVETWLYNLINALGNNYNITVVSPKASKGSLKIHDMGSSVSLIHYKSFDGAPLLRNRLSLIAQYLKIYQLKNILYNLCKNNKQSSISIVCLDTVICGHALNLVRKKRVGFDYIVSIRGPHAEVLSKSYPYYTSLYNKWELATLNNCDIILANGEDTKALYEKKISRPIFVMKNGVSIKQIKKGLAKNVFDIEKKDGENLILSVATLIPIKGVYKIVEAIHEYVQKYRKDIRVIFVGKGNQQALISYAENLGVDRYISCVGEKTNVEDYYAIADVVVCASGGSGLSMSMLEALASQKPIVAIDTPVYQQFNKNNTLNLTPDSPEGIAQGLFKVVSNYEDEKVKSQRNIELAREYDWSKVAADFIGYIENKNI